MNGEFSLIFNNFLPAKISKKFVYKKKYFFEKKKDFFIIQQQQKLDNKNCQWQSSHFIKLSNMSSSLSIFMWKKKKNNNKWTILFNSILNPQSNNNLKLFNAMIRDWEICFWYKKDAFAISLGEINIHAKTSRRKKHFEIQ